MKLSKYISIKYILRLKHHSEKEDVEVSSASIAAKEEAPDDFGHEISFCNTFVESRCLYINFIVRSEWQTTKKKAAT